MSDEAMRLVPVEPTEAMIEAGYEPWLNKTGGAGRYIVRNVFKAMLSATPSTRDEVGPVAGEGGLLTVWYGSMPESNGRQNWTAVLHRKSETGFDIHGNGFCFARSEYPDRVRYEADHMRWIIGELAEKPCVLDYDDKAHSGYVAPVAAPPAPQDDALRDSADLFKALRDESWDLRCFDRPTGGDDYDIGWRVVGHWQAEPRERTIAEVFVDDPAEAVRQALAALKSTAGQEEGGA